MIRLILALLQRHRRKADAGLGSVDQAPRKPVEYMLANHPDDDHEWLEALRKAGKQ
jgi:hypothetical protein